MGLIHAALVLPLMLGGADEWDDAWSWVLEVAGAPLDEEWPALDATVRLVHLVKQHPDDPRSSTLAEWLTSRGAMPGSTARPADRPLSGNWCWLQADLLDDGPRRTESYAKALRDGTHPPATVWLQQAWEYGVRCAREHLWLDDAVAVQRELHAIYGAAWSAMNLAGSLHRAGRVDEADAVLAAQEALEPSPAEIQNTRGIHALGRGDERVARDHLGRSLARGYRDSALVLARLDQTRGDLPGARAGFRALLHVDPSAGETPHAWALRGWGMTLLSPEDR